MVSLSAAMEVSEDHECFVSTVQQGIATNTGQQVLRSAERQFNFSTDCFYCGKPATFGRQRKDSDVVPVRTVETRDTIIPHFQQLS